MCDVKGTGLRALDKRRMELDITAGAGASQVSHKDGWFGGVMAVLQESFVHSVVICSPHVPGTKDTNVSGTLGGRCGPGQASKCLRLHFME